MLSTAIKHDKLLNLNTISQRFTVYYFLESPQMSTRNWILETLCWYLCNVSIHTTWFDCILS